MSFKGMMIAASVAGMFATGAARVASAADKKGEDVMCAGINGCKGQSSCRGAGNACAGKNGCKGQGNMKVSKDECQAKGGKIVK
jgi:hypothetical protein